MIDSIYPSVTAVLSGGLAEGIDSIHPFVTTVLSGVFEDYDPISSAPAVTIESIHPAVTIESIHPAVTIESTHPAVTIESTHPAVTIEPIHPAVTIESIHPTVTIESIHPAVTIEPIHPAVTIESIHPAVTIEPIYLAVLTVLSGGLAGGIVGLIGNYYLQTKMQKFRNIDDLMNKFYNLLELSTIYWLAAGKNIKKRRALEAQIIASQMIIRSDYLLFKNRYKQIKKSSSSTAKAMMELWDATTGGCFQEPEWKPDNYRVIQAAVAIKKIVESFR